MNVIVFLLLGLLAITAVAIARLRELWAVIMFTGIYSFLSASWMLILDAPDVAFTEAAVGAGISTVLLLSTMALTGKAEDIPRSSSMVPLFVVTVTGAALVYGTLDMPHFGSPDAPAQVYPSPSFMERSQGDMHGLPNVVTALLASYRGYDTLGETTVVLTAGIAVLLILRRTEDERPPLATSSPTPLATLSQTPLGGSPMPKTPVPPAPLPQTEPSSGSTSDEVQSS